MACRDSNALSLFLNAILIEDGEGQLAAFAFITKPAMEFKDKKSDYTIKSDCVFNKNSLFALEKPADWSYDFFH